MRERERGRDRQRQTENKKKKNEEEEETLLGSGTIIKEREGREFVAKMDPLSVRGFGFAGPEGRS